MAELVRSSPTGEGAEIVPGAAGRPPGADVSSRSGTPRVGSPTGEAGASTLKDQAREVVSQQVSRKAERSADDIHEVAAALRRTNQELSGNVAAPYVDRAAQQLDRLSGFLRTADANQVVRGVESFARREPLLFLGGAFTLGILAARFLKSSARHGAGQGEYRGYPGVEERSFARVGYGGEGERSPGMTEYSAADPRSVTRREYPPAATEPKSDISHSAAGPVPDVPRGTRGAP